MQYSQLLLIIIHCLVVTISSHAMDYTPKFDLNAIEEITTVEEPWRVCYVTNKIAIVGKNGCCNILDLKTKESQCIAKGNRFTCEFPIIESNNNKIIIAHGTRVTIYNGNTGKQEWAMSNLEGEIRSLALHPVENTFFLCYGEQREIIKNYNYVSSKHKDIPILDQYCQMMTINPQKEIICIADYCGSISLRKLDNIAASLQTITLPTAYCRFCKYNLDGSCIIAGNTNQLYIIDPDEVTNLYPTLKVPKYRNFDRIAFHPNGFVLATLSGPLSLSSLEPYIIYYWNLKTQQLIGEASMVLPGAARDICFSDDGLEVVVALKDKCIRMLVPFAVKEKYSYLLFVLNELKEQNNLPKDIVKYSMHILLKHICL